MSNSLQILKKLISFDTSISKDTLDAVYYVKEYLDSKGAKTRLIYNEKKTRASLLATIGNEDKAGIILSGHLDTVSVKKEEWDNNPHILTEIDDKYYGRGTSDMKGGISCALGNIEYLQKSDITFHFVLTHDEEGIFSAIKQLNENNFYNFFKVKPLGCLVMEPTMLEAIYAHKGTYLAKIKVLGKESHSAYPHLGVDSLYYIIKIYNKIHEIFLHAKQNLNTDEQYNPQQTTLNICTLNSGDAINKIPGFAELTYSIRYLPQDDISFINDKIKKYCEEINSFLKKENEDTGVIYSEILDIKGFESDITSDFVNNFDKLKKVSYGTEAGYFQNLGIDTIVFGPGSIEQAHIKNEFIEKKQIEKFDDFIKNNLCNFKIKSF